MGPCYLRRNLIDQINGFVPSTDVPAHWETMASWCKGARCLSVVRAFAHGAMGRRIDPSWAESIELFLVPASAPKCNKGRGMCYLVCGMIHIKEPLLLIGKSSICGGSGFPFSLLEWSLAICLTPYNRKFYKCVECVVK